MDSIFDLESEVRKYCRDFPVVFTKAKGCELFDESGNRYLDFFSGAGALNYGHNNAIMTSKLIKYLRSNQIVHGLDFATTAKKDFLQKFNSIILAPKKMNYKFQFTGPTGSNAVEAALMLARKITKRKSVVYFNNSFHGFSLGALSVTSNSFYRRNVHIPKDDTIAIPFYDSQGIDSGDLLQNMIKKFTRSEIPAAIIVETVQAEGGVNVASSSWLQNLQNIAKQFNIIFIVDDIQVGCGRTGTFFSFDDAGIKPDIICLSKSLSGYGIPFSMLLIKPEYDLWEPGEHGGTFRSNNLAFITGAAALDYWRTDDFSKSVKLKSKFIESRLREIVIRNPNVDMGLRGKGFIWGVELKSRTIAKKVCKAAFNNGLIVETVGCCGQVLKLIPPLIIDEVSLTLGLSVLEASILSVSHV